MYFNGTKFKPSGKQSKVYSVLDEHLIQIVNNLQKVEECMKLGKILGKFKYPEGTVKFKYPGMNC